jgi:hypothetical protein
MIPYEVKFISFLKCILLNDANMDLYKSWPCGKAMLKVVAGFKEI